MATSHAALASHRLSYPSAVDAKFFPSLFLHQAGSLRLGGVPTSSGDHLLIVGDAAGMIDPLTGEGIHHAMEGGKIAAEFMLEAIAAGNYSADAMQIYHERWMERFGNDFTWSMNICQFLYRFPVLIDAATAAVRRKGDKFLARYVRPSLFAPST